MYCFSVNCIDFWSSCTFCWFFALQNLPPSEALHFLCVEVLLPSQLGAVMLSTVSLLNNTFTGQAKSSQRLTSIVHTLSPETDNGPSWICAKTYKICIIYVLDLRKGQNDRRKYCQLIIPASHELRVLPQIKIGSELRQGNWTWDLLTLNMEPLVKFIGGQNNVISYYPPSAFVAKTNDIAKSERKKLHFFTH